MSDSAECTTAPPLTDDKQSWSAPPLKILMTADAVGGVWQYSLDLIEPFVKRSAEILLATMGPRPDEAKKERLGAFERVTVCESDYKLEWMQQPWEDVDRAGAWLLELAQQFQPDVIHLNGYAHAVLPWQAPIVVVAHSCVYSWWQSVHGSAPPEKDWSEYHARVSAGLRTADIVVAPSAFMATALTTHYGMPVNRVRVIYNYSESPLYSSAEKEPFYLSAGRIWDKGKNLKLLDDISPGLPWPVRVAGSLTHGDLLQQMQIASVYVHPALYEPFGLAVLEAARAQCCLVLSDIPSMRELWDGAAIFVNPRDADEWARVLSRVANDSAEREAFGQLARTHSARYSAAATVDQYCRAYESLAVREVAAA